MASLKRPLVRLVAVAALLLTTASQGLVQSFNEYQVKAVFLFNFAQFVEWSKAAAEPGDQPFAICILGDDPFSEALDETVRGESLGTRRFEIRRLRAVTEAKDCQILFVSSSESRQLRPILDTLKGRAVLTVGDSENFARRGGMVQFQTENKRIKLMINVDAARAANLTISSKLLRPATIVSSSGD
jgi:hypothetical protein